MTRQLTKSRDFRQNISVISISAPCFFSFLPLSVLVMMARHSSSLSTKSRDYRQSYPCDFHLCSLLIPFFLSYHCQYWWWWLATPLRCPQSLETIPKVISVISISAPCSFLPLSVLVVIARHSSSLSTKSWDFRQNYLCDFHLCSLLFLTIVSTGNDGSPLLFAVHLLPDLLLLLPDHEYVSLSVNFFLCGRQIRFFRRNTVQNIFYCLFRSELAMYQLFYE